MATQPKIRPPFVWLGKYTALMSIVSSIAIGVFFRFFQLRTLPPGIHSASAALGLQATDLADRGIVPGLNSINGYAPLWVFLQASSIKLFGHTELALKLWPALLGTLAILVTWLWVRSWFGLRLAWLTSLLLAFIPWAVTLSRAGMESAAFPLLTSLTLYTGTLAWRNRTMGAGLALAATIALDLLAGPVGWLLALTVITVGLVISARTKQLFRIDKSRLVFMGGLAVGLAGLGYFVGTSVSSLKALPSVAGLTANATTLGTNLVRTLLMFNVRGDENYRHNLSGEPLLNAFVGLMFVAGILVAISRLHERRYRILYVTFIVLLLPAIVTTVGAPNAARAAATLPLVLTFAAVGISYMLELWYRTFPINSAARSTGQAAILVLLGLSLFQGYTQYFQAWANTAEVYSAHNEGAAAMGRYILDDGSFKGAHYTVASQAELPVVAYLVHHSRPYTAIVPKDLVALPITPGTRKFVISAAARDEAVKALKLKFPGGILRPILSPVNQAEIFYTYEVTK